MSFENWTADQLTSSTLTFPVMCDQCSMVIGKNNNFNQFLIFYYHELRSGTQNPKSKALDKLKQKFSDMTLKPCCELHFLTHTIQ